jgi:hypothetical protein
MLHTTRLIFAAFLVICIGDRTPGAGLSGNWKMTPTGQGALWLINFESKDGKVTGSVVDHARQRVPPTTLEDLSLEGDRLRFTLKLQGQSLRFDGKVPAGDPKRILGSFELGRRLVTAQLDATKMADLEDAFQASKEMLASDPNNPELFETVIGLLRQATAKHASPEEVRGWADKLFKLAESYGTRWQRDIGVRIAEALANQPGLGPVAVEYARRTERLLDPADDATAQIRVLDALAMALRKTDKESEAKEVDAKIEKLEAKADAEYLKTMPPFQATTYDGQRKSGHPVLVELFTGAQCPPCVAADLGFDGLEKTYKSTDVILLQYHLNIPAPDPLANADSEARQQYYGDEVEGTPTIFFDGKSRAGGGGPLAAGKNKYAEYRGVINPLLEATGPAPKLRVSASRKGDKLEIQAEVADLESPGEKTRLRLALVEEQVRYVGTNSLRFHHHVVRALPGGAAGFPLTQKSARHTATLDLGELQKALRSSMAKFNKRGSADKKLIPFNNLRVVAFIQSDESKQILQAMQVEVGEDGVR